MRNLRSVAIRAAISLILAAALWAFVSFSENPNQRRNFDDLPVVAENVPPGLVIVDEAGIPLQNLPYSVDVTIVAPMEIFSRVTRSSIQPYIDLSGYESGTHSVPVQIRLNQPQLQIVEIEPKQVPVRLEREITTTVPLNVRLIGQPPFSYEARKPEVGVGGRTINQVIVRGPASQVQRVEEARIEIDISGQTNTIQAQRQPMPVDTTGSAVAGVTIIPQQLEVRVPIISSAGLKRVPVLAKWRGVPADGYALVRITPAPAFVEIVGRAATLDNVSFVETQPVDISGASEPFTRSTRLILPEGVALSNPQEAEVQVEVIIQPVDLNFSLSLQVPVVPVNLEPGLNAIIEPQLLRVSLSGSTQSLMALRSGDLEATIDLQGLGPGTYTIMPQLNLPAGINLESALEPVTVTIVPVATVTPVPPTPALTETVPLSPTVTP